jgi:xylulokinase
MDAVTVGLDIGTTSIKAVAVDGGGRVLERARITHQVIVPAPDLMEHDAGRAWRQGPRRALAALGAVNPVAVAVAAMVPSLTAVDRRGRPLTPGLLYGDGRARRRPDGTGPEPDGAGGGNEVEGLLRWTAAAAPQAMAYWPAQAVANFALGGRPAIDYAVASMATPLFAANGWDPEACARSGVRVDQMPDVAGPGAPVGRIEGAASQPLLTSGSVDVWCEQLVSGAENVGDVHVICGTTLIVWAIGSTGAGPDPHPAIWSIPRSVDGQQLVGGASNAGGLFLNWVDRLAGRSGADRGVSPHRVPVWIPYPRGERTPYHDPERRAALHDLDLTHGPAAVRQAAWEASAFVVRHHLDLSGVTGRRIVATGGGTRIPGWMQALADVTGLPVHVAAEPEGAARGAAFLARMAAGLESALSDAARWASTGHIVEPRHEWIRAAEPRYRRFLELSGPPPA